MKILDYCIRPSLPTVAPSAFGPKGWASLLKRLPPCGYILFSWPSIITQYRVVTVQSWTIVTLIYTKAVAPRFSVKYLMQTGLVPWRRPFFLVASSAGSHVNSDWTPQTILVVPTRVVCVCMALIVFYIQTSRYICICMIALILSNYHQFLGKK